ncbi:lipopolysaccharide biosynthesis protein [Vibrio vulnificus]|uniref:lipopolysaccharide biosynthesis protein n=1 Tax=Vibrio vulnificus TaxID=672 RepID=UPI000A384B32|nr:oligosaccharide flippase family protein [Vibrio vulnificus]EGQ8026535.1 oligosaccharide flippase family protein [Vibrio vulnificus]EHH0850031.1 oligosaccharide flippase family protein [Vibrio vulnificus]EHH2473113.1 oligosaccharide flippase family protein [Vibrio vulnificus]EHU5129342.1 oligosaccharide flippase family protein [Vibrio vulnificus]EIZ1408706.1 oligosaccharide flippase family protein [Vibrio vulnificus]
MYRKFRNVVNLCAIFSAKLGSILVSVVFLPIFNKLFGAEDFGIITLIISLQTLLITLDLGMSILVGRDAAYETHDKFYNTLKSSEKLIFFIYLILTIFAVVFIFIFHDFELTIKVLLACVLFFSLTLQNIYYSSLNGRQEYISNAISQLVASFSRAIVTLSVVYYIETSIMAFLLAQCAVSLVNLVFIRLFLIKKYRGFDNKSSASFSDINDIAKRGKALMLYGMAGAAIMQLDKSLISITNGPEALGPYFLAFSFCMLPISALATPIVQFFQPKLFHYYSEGDKLGFGKNSKHFAFTLVCLVIVPSLVAYVYSDEIVKFWLGNVENKSVVSDYVQLMMPGIIFASLGYIPVSLLLMVQDYQFQAILAWLSCIVVLLFVFLFSYFGKIKYICILYSLYFILTSLACWIRAMNIDEIKSESAFCIKLFTVPFMFLVFIFVVF